MTFDVDVDGMTVEIEPLYQFTHNIFLPSYRQLLVKRLFDVM